MAYNPIQFQQGMSLPEFLQCFGTEAVCAEAVRRARWPDGFVCPRCKRSAHCVIVSGSRRLLSVINQFDGPPIKLGDGR